MIHKSELYDINGITGEAPYFFCVLKMVNPQWPHAILLPWSAMKNPLPHLLQKGLFLSIFPSLISYIS